MLSATNEEDSGENSVCSGRSSISVDGDGCWPQCDWYQGRQSPHTVDPVSLYPPFTSSHADELGTNLFAGSAAGCEPVSVIRYTGSKWDDSTSIDGATQPKESCDDPLFQRHDKGSSSVYDPAPFVMSSERVDDRPYNISLPANGWNLFPLAQCKDASAPDGIEARQLLSAGATSLWNFSRSVSAALNCQSGSANPSSAYEMPETYALPVAGSCGAPSDQTSAANGLPNLNGVFSFPHQRAHSQQIPVPGNTNMYSSTASSLTCPPDGSVDACVLQSLQSPLKGSDAEVEGAVFSNNLPFEDQIRFRKRDYFGMPVNLSVLSKSDCTGQVVYSITTSCARSMNKRKNKNPLATKFTVRKLKQLLQCQEAALRTSKYQVHMDGSSVSGQPAFIVKNAGGRRQTSSIPVFPTSTPIHAESYGGNFLQGVAANSPLVNGPFAANTIELIQQKSPKAIARSQRPRFFDFESLEIGHFVVNQMASSTAGGNKLRLYFSKQQIIYDFVWSNDGLPLKQFVAVVVRFSTIIGMHFQGSSIIIAVSEPPRCVLSSGKVSPVKRHCDQDCDITNGELTNSSVHKITLCRAQALIVRDLLLHNNAEMKKFLFHFELGYGAVYNDSGERCPFADHWLLSKELQENGSMSATVETVALQGNCDAVPEALVDLEGTAPKSTVSSDSEFDCHF